MTEPTVAAGMDQAIREYIQACNDGDIPRIAAFLHTDAVHYYPNLPKFVGIDDRHTLLEEREG